MYRIAVVGCGGVSAMHFEGCRRHPARVAVVAACDPNEAAARQAQEKYGLSHVGATVEEIIAATAWDAAIVCTPTPVREAVVAALAAAGKAIFVEKPLADNYAAAQRMVELCAAHGVPLAVNQNFRYHYPFHLARERIADGAIGPVVSVLHRDLFFRQDSGWRVQQTRHALAVMGIHWLDGFRWMLGQEAQSVWCRTAQSPAIACAGETEVWAHLAFADGATVDSVQSFSSRFASTETIVIGAAGTLRLDYDGVTLHAPGAAPQHWNNARYGGANKPESAFCGLHELLSAREAGREPSNSGRDNLRTVALLEAAYHAATTGQAVRPTKAGS